MARKKNTEKTNENSLAHAIRLCVDNGKVEFGSNKGVKKVLSGKAKLIVIANNCPADALQDVKHFCKLSGIPSIIYEGTSIELGTVAGRPHPVAIMTVIDAGNSGILEMSK